jgi:non-homologous end joining protein Ku
MFSVPSGKTFTIPDPVSGEEMEMSTASKRTTFAWGFATAPVALFKTTGDSKLPEFEKAGPEGGELYKEPRVRLVEKEVEEGDSPVPVLTEPLDAGVDLQASIEMHERDAARLRGILAAQTASEPETYTALVERGTAKEVTAEEVRRGVRLADGSFVDLTDQLNAVDAQTDQDELRVVSFIRVEQVPRARILGSYYLGSDGPGAPKVLRLLYEALRQTHRVAVIKWVKNTRQALGVISPYPRENGALVILELAWEEDWRAPSGRCLVHQQAQVTSQELAAAVELIDAMADSVKSVDELSDDRRRMYRQVREAAESGHPVAIGTPPVLDAEMDLTAALEASLARADEFSSFA